ncbi:MAG TPA: ethylbenzene dehydrogenase-related protein [Azospirillaceae bacterium]|nr:ethylbenzene dehydrogenase-related protein [Azospirillaceae bacterium]
MTLVHTRSVQETVGAVGRPRLRTDATTVALHWGIALLLVASLATGFRIAADAEDATLSRWLSPILPQGEVTRWHGWFAGGLIVLAATYVAFLVSARLTPRIALDGSRLRALSARDHRTRWQSINVLVYWIAFAALALVGTTGALLYLEIPVAPHGLVTTAHRVGAWVLVAYVVLHVAAQAAMGGGVQLLKILRPRAAYGFPALVGALLGMAAAAGVAAVDRGRPQTLAVAAVPAAPRLDGDPNDAAWAAAWPVVIETVRGANFPGGSVAVTVRAVHDQTHAYFLFQWPDATRSQKHLPLHKTEAGWQILETDYARQDEDAYYEDKFAVMLARSPVLAGAGTSHLGGKPLADKPAPSGGRGLHFTSDGSYVDVWHWKSVRTGPMGQIDDNHFGPPLAPPAKPGDRYTGGYTQDPHTGGGFIQNWRKLADGTVQPLHLPRDPGVLRRLGPIDLDPSLGDKGDWWLPRDLTVPYSAELDAEYPIGTVLPSVVIDAPFEGDRGDVRAAGRWLDGRWHLEVSRRLDTGSAFDTPIADGIFLWVAAFDHSQTRHSQHLHPVRLSLR